MAAHGCGAGGRTGGARWLRLPARPVCRVERCAGASTSCDEDRPAADQIGEPPAEQHQPACEEDVGRDDPLTYVSEERATVLRPVRQKHAIPQNLLR